MSSPHAERNGDIAVLLYAAPFIINFLYAIYLWAGAGFSAILPQLVYLEVTQNPYVFLLGFAAVSGAAMIDFDSSTVEARRSSLVSLSKRLQWIAALSFILACLAALYSAAGNPANMAYNLLDGRYPLIFPAVLLLLSFAILPTFRFQRANTRNGIVLLLLFASPVALYEVGKRSVVAGLGVGLILVLVAAYLMVLPKKE